MASATNTAGNNNLLKNKIDLVVTRKLSLDKEFLSVVDYVSPLLEGMEIDGQTERKLMRKIENRQDDINRHCLQQFEKANELVKKFDETVQSMDKICFDLSSRLEKVKKINTDLLVKTTELQASKKIAEQRQVVIDNFLQKFSLSEEEARLLSGEYDDCRLSPQFFSALQRAEEIHKDCEELIRSTGSHLAAMEVMDQMEKKIKAAHTIIFNNITREFRQLSSDSPNSKNVISRALSALQDFPYMLQVSLDEYSSIRSNEVLREYIDALTKGPHGSGKPIEMLVHDKMRYVGDMLAFIYEQAENERQMLEQLLSQCDPKALDPAAKTKCLDQVTKILCTPFKVRVEQALSAERECAVFYKISSMFNFYIEKFGTLTGVKSELTSTLSDLNTLAMSMFNAGLVQQVQQRLSKMSAPDYDLLPVPAVHQCLMLLREVLDTHDGGMGARSSTKDDFQKMFEMVLDPLTREIQITATQLHSPLDVAVYTLNCLSVIQSVVILYQFSSSRLEMINAMVEGNADVMVSEEVSTILTKTGLINVYQKASQHGKEQGPLAKIPGMEREVVSRVLNEFSMFLHEPAALELDHIAKIRGSRIREMVRERSISELLKVYRAIVEKLKEESNGYGDMAYLTEQQVEQLLQLSFMKI